MTCQTFLYICSALLSTIGSILTAVSLNRVVIELDFARKALDATVRGLAHNARNVVIFSGLDERYERATFWSASMVYVGIFLLALGCSIQIFALCIPEKIATATIQSLWVTIFSQ